MITSAMLHAHGDGKSLAVVKSWWGSGAAPIQSGYYRALFQGQELLSSIVDVRQGGCEVSVREAENDAARLLSASWYPTREVDPLPVDPFVLAGELGIKVKFVALPEDESGNITISPDGSVIRLNRSDSRNRQRFTCAHEIGHYYRRVQQGLNESKVYTDRRAQLASAGTDHDEIYANQFAAALLMPATLVQQGYVVHRQSPETLAYRFGTSPQAMHLRLRNLNLD